MGFGTIRVHHSLNHLRAITLCCTANSMSKPASIARLIASGPAEGHPLLAELCGWTLVEDDATGEHELVPV